MSAAFQAGRSPEVDCRQHQERLYVIVRSLFSFQFMGWVLVLTGGVTSFLEQATPRRDQSNNVVYDAYVQLL